MILLRLISYQYVRKHVLRTLLTLTGIVLGVAVFVGMHTANQSVLFAFEKTIDHIAGAAQLQVTAGETGFEEAALERVQAVAGVRVAAPVIEAVAHTNLAGQGNLLVLGVDMLGDRSLRDYDLEGSEEGAIDDPLVFLAQPDSLIVTKPFAERNGLATNSHVMLNTAEGPKQFTVRGVMRAGGLTSAFGGNLAVMDIYAAQKMFGRGRMFDRIDIALNEGVSVAEGSDRLRRALGPGFQVDTPTSRGAQFEAVASVYKVVANITSVCALFIGMFLIYNTFAIAVTQRRAEIGILRALGATEGQVRRLFLAESAAAGLIASAVGVLAGMLLARGMAGYIGAFMGEVYGIAERAQQVSTDPRLVFAALAIGVTTSVLAAAIPARNAARIDPVKALQKGRHQSLGEGESRRRRRLAVGAVAISVICALGKTGPLLYLGYFVTIIAAVLIAPAVGVWLARMLRPALSWLAPVEGALAADSLIQAPRRTSGTIAALMLSVALVTGMGGIARASYTSILTWVDTSLNPDMFVCATEKLTDRSYRFPREVGDQLRRVPGVAAVHEVRVGRIPFRGRPIMLTAIDVAAFHSRAGMPPIEGDPEGMYRDAAAGKGLLVADNLAIIEHLRVGDVVELPTPGGLLRLPVAGVVTDYSDQQGDFLIDLAVYRKYWNDDTVNVFRVYVAPGAKGPDVERAIQAQVGSRQRLFVLTNREVRAYISNVTDQWFGLTYVQIAVAVLVSVLGIINSLTVSITDRKRELGVLQAVGAVRGQIRRTVWIESLTIALIGVLPGLALGALQLYYWLEIARRDISGYRVDYMFPFGIVAALVPVMLAAALAAAIGPAEAAVRGSLVEALEYE
ncbi:MAG: FtsX-like permease family protein [Acidobacteria bacterium]|nr:FtsX-like permease family protein [Acidobacteriota bacterium]